MGFIHAPFIFNSANRLDNRAILVVFRILPFCSPVPSWPIFLSLLSPIGFGDLLRLSLGFDQSLRLCFCRRKKRKCLA